MLTHRGGRSAAAVRRPAGPQGLSADLAVLVAEAYGLTSRELQITQLVARLFTEHYWPALPEPVRVPGALRQR